MCLDLLFGLGAVFFDDDDSGFLLGFVVVRVCLSGMIFCRFSTESLILAQDERWRRA